MKNISLHISHLLLILIAIKITQNEAAKIISSGNSTNVSDNIRNYEELSLESSSVSDKVETSETPTDVVATQQDARETKYSYFYVGRWTWHIPLWFTLWFSFYVFFNVIRSIQGHSIDPDDYARRKREIRSPVDGDEIDRITNFAVKSFEKFKNKKR